MLRAALATTLALLLAACAALPERFDPPRVTLSDITPAQIGLLEQRFRLALRIQNPNEVELPLDGLSFELEVNGKPFATGVSRQGVRVPALGEAVMELDAVSDLGGILRQLAELERGRGSAGLGYRIKGKVHVSGRGAVPLEHAGELGLPLPDAPRREPAAPPEGTRL